MTKANDEWQTIEPGIWKPENEGDQIEGVLVNKEPRDEVTGTTVSGTTSRTRTACS